MKSIRSKRLAGAALVLIAGGAALLNIYPYRPRSAVGWCLLFTLALPLWFFFEFVGERFAGSRFVASLNLTAKIGFGVLIGGGFVLLTLMAFSILEPFLNEWGS